MKKILLNFAITLIIFSVFVWSSKTTSTSTVVIVKEVRSGEIVIQNLNGKNLTIKTTNIVEKSIHENNEYFVNYTQRKWGMPKLKQIEPV